MHMNICNKLFKTLMVFTTLMYCENGYTMNPGFSIRNFSIDYMRNQEHSCIIDTDGKIYTPQWEEITYDGAPCFDLKTKVAKIDKHCDPISIGYTGKNNPEYNLA